MSVICNKCGIQTRDRAKFCHGCGTPISTAALPATMPIGVPSGDITPKPAVPLAPEPPINPNFAKATEAIGTPQTSYIPQAPGPNYHQAIAKPKKSGKGIKIFIAILIFLGVVIGGGIIGGLFIANKALNTVKNNIPPSGIPIQLGENVRVNIGTPVLTEAELGVPPYPDAKPTSPFNISGQTDSGERGSFVTLETKDDYDVVVEWYLEKLGNDARRTKKEDNEKKVTKYELDDERGFRSVEITGYHRNRKNTEIKIFSAMNASDEKAPSSVSASPAAQAGKKKPGVVPVPPVAADELGDSIEKKVNESLDETNKLVDEQLERKPIPARIKRQIREQFREARKQERNAAASPNQN